eukprot:163675-Rhodomonas_salina.1
MEGSESWRSGYVVGVVDNENGNSVKNEAKKPRNVSVGEQLSLLRKAVSGNLEKGRRKAGSKTRLRCQMLDG